VNHLLNLRVIRLKREEQPPNKVKLLSLKEAGVLENSSPRYLVGNRRLKRKKKDG